MSVKFVPICQIWNFQDALLWLKLPINFLMMLLKLPLANTKCRTMNTYESKSTFTEMNALFISMHNYTIFLAKIQFYLKFLPFVFHIEMSSFKFFCAIWKYLLIPSLRSLANTTMNKCESTSTFTKNWMKDYVTIMKIESIL